MDFSFAEISILYFLFLMPVHPKNQKVPPRIHSPDPFLRGGIHIQKFFLEIVAEVLRILSPENCFAKPSPHCISHIRPFPLEKLCASHRGAQAHGCAIVWIFSRIFDKVSSSSVVKILPKRTKWFGRCQKVGRAKRVPLSLP
jgi:hypothetical protein